LYIKKYLKKSKNMITSVNPLGHYGPLLTPNGENN